jgi:uncharacterized protein YjcR
MDKRLIRPLEGYMAIPQIVEALGLSRARIHQLIEEDKFDIDDMRVVGDKRLVIIKNAAVYKQLAAQEERAKRIAADKEAEEQRIVARMAVKAAEHSLHNAPTDNELAPSFEATDIPLELASEDETSEVFPTLEGSQV